MNQLAMAGAQFGRMVAQKRLMLSKVLVYHSYGGTSLQVKVNTVQLPQKLNGCGQLSEHDYDPLEPIYKFYSKHSDQLCTIM